MSETRKLISCLVVLSLMPMVAYAGTLNTVRFDDFEDGDYTINPTWTPNNAADWEVNDSPHGNNKYLKGVNSDNIYITFPTYIYNSCEPNTVNPGGPEWRITFRYSNGRYNGTNNSQWIVHIGTLADTDKYMLSENDRGDAYIGGTKFSFYCDGSAATQGWGGGGDAVGIKWYWMTFEYEASNGTLHAIHYDPATGQEQSGFWQPWTEHSSFERVEIETILLNGKNWLFDDIRVEVVKEPETCEEVLASGSITGDLNQDCVVNIVDLAIMVSDWILCNNPDDPQCQLPAATVSVAPAISVSESGGDDLALLRSFFHGGSWESPLDANTWQWLADVEVDKTRIINVTKDSSMSGSNFVPSAKLVQALDDAQTYNLVPHLIVGQSCPGHMDCSNIDSWDAGDWDNYEDYAYALVDYVVTDPCGFDSVNFEVDNEPDIMTTAWWIEGTHSEGSTAMYNSYYAVYRVWSNAVSQVDSENPSRAVRIGGPAITSYTFNWGDFNWAVKFATDCGAEPLRMDFLSWHCYGNNAKICGRSSPVIPVPSLAVHNQIIRDALDNAGLTNTAIAITEWGPSSEIDGSLASQINANHVGAAWTAAALTDMVTAGTDEAIELIFRDHYYPPVPPGSTADIDNMTWPAFLSADSAYPKPMYNVFKMYTMMPGQRVSCTDLSGNLGAFASANSSSVGVLVYNYNWNYESVEDSTSSEAIRIRIDGLPFSANTARIRRYLIDAGNSNLYEFVQSGQPIDLTEAELNKVEEYIRSVDQSSNSVETYVTNLGPSAVSLWLVDDASE